MTAVGSAAEAIARADAARTMMHDPGYPRDAPDGDGAG